MTLIKILCLVEEKARNLGLDADQRLELRLKESKHVFDTFGQWLHVQYAQVTPASTIGKAIQYAINRWKNMTLLFVDGNIEIDNAEGMPLAQPGGEHYPPGGYWA